MKIDIIVFRVVCLTFMASISPLSTHQCAICLIGNLLSLVLRNWLAFYAEQCKFSVFVLSCIDLCIPHVIVVHILCFVTYCKNLQDPVTYHSFMRRSSCWHCSAAPGINYQQTEDTRCHVSLLCLYVWRHSKVEWTTPV